MTTYFNLFWKITYLLPILACKIFYLKLPIGENFFTYFGFSIYHLHRKLEGLDEIQICNTSALEYEFSFRILYTSRKHYSYINYFLPNVYNFCYGPKVGLADPTNKVKYFYKWEKSWIYFYCFIIIIFNFSLNTFNLRYTLK